MFTSKKAKEIQYKRWRKERGIRFAVSIKPKKGGLNQATAEFEGVTYHAFGKDNLKALENLFEKHLLKLKI